ncbi:restriction endonuclease [Clostridium sp. Bc-iso-3]|nr:restriction endonuclease [Clostridium sp. Bc-iso-3]
MSDKNHPEEIVLTIIQGKGTIARDESDRNISYSKESIPTYKLVKVDDFIMHLRSFEGGLEIATKEGIVSPAYTILRNKIDIVPQFYRYYFRSSNFIVEKLTGITEGIRDGRSINMDDFWMLEIPYPSIPEQKKIGEFLDLINQQIQIEKDKLEAIKAVKKGLLQQMFV